MNMFRDLERRIDERLRRLFQSEPAPGQGRELVEIQRLVLDRVDERVQMLPRARSAFPFNEIAVRIPMRDPERRAAFEMVFISDDALEEEILEHLRRDGVEFPRDLQVAVSLVETEELTEPSVVCRTRETVKSTELDTGPLPELRPVRFKAMTGEVTEIARNRIQIGRIAEVFDDRRRMVRRNDVILGGNTVSRAHAHIEFAAGEYRLFDDGSSYGTSVIHEGRLVDVPSAGGRGLRLRSGDDLYFGQTRVLFEIL